MNRNPHFFIISSLPPHHHYVPDNNFYGQDIFKAPFQIPNHELIAERTQAGLAAARARGRLGGRPRKMDRATLAMAMADHNAVAADVARRLGMTTTTLYTYINGDGSLKAPGQAMLNGAPLLTEGKGV